MNCDECGKEVRFYQKRFNSIWSINQVVHYRCRVAFLKSIISKMWPMITDSQRLEVNDWRRNIK